MDKISENNTENDINTAPLLVQCWACREKNRVPCWQGIPVPLMQCNACGALIENINGDMTGTVDPTIEKDIMLKGRSSQQRLIGIAVATLVLAKITFVAVSASYFITPELVPKGATFLVPLQTIFFFLYSFIVIAYFTVIMRHPGPVKMPPPTAATMDIVHQQNSQGRLANWRWCFVCAAPKSPTAHHCRRCGLCVEGLDHHCIFTANSCIGAGNIRHFMAFLKLLVIGAVLSTLLSLGFGWKMRLRILHHSLEVWNGPRPFGRAIHMLTYTAQWTLFAPRILAVWIMSFILSLGTALGVSLLLNRQYKVARKGTTVLEEMRRKLAAKNNHGPLGERCLQIAMENDGKIE